ncbi:predicted protein [Postia placenta Mad-698-R]|nr:predicted protein [Postia placenta Mad-698-R]
MSIMPRSKYPTSAYSKAIKINSYMRTVVYAWFMLGETSGISRVTIRHSAPSQATSRTLFHEKIVAGAAPRLRVYMVEKTQKYPSRKVPTSIVMSSLPIDEAQLIALFMQSVTYGIHVATFTVCFGTLINKQDSSLPVHWPWFSIAVALFVVGTIDVSFNLYHNLIASIFYVGPGGAEAEFLDISTWVNVIRMYRCWIICNRKWGLMAFPMLLWILAIGTAITDLYFVSTLRTTTTLVDQKTLQPLIIAYLVMTLVDNGLCTGMIVHRIWQISRQSSEFFTQTFRGSGRTNLRDVIVILIESALLYTASILATFVSAVAKSSINYEVTGIAFDLIIIRINGGTSAEQTQAFTDYGAHSNVAVHVSMSTTLDAGITHMKTSGSQKAVGSGTPASVEVVELDRYFHRLLVGGYGARREVSSWWNLDRDCRIKAVINHFLLDVVRAQLISLYWDFSANGDQLWTYDLDCIEDELLYTLSNVRMSINAQRPVNRLPVEILSEIFHQVLPPFKLASYLHDHDLKEFLVRESFFDFKNTDALLPLTHACRWWRDVALDTPTLWTTLYGSSHSDAIGEYYLRSQGAPLKVLNIKNTHLDVQYLWQVDGQRIQSLASKTGCHSDLPTSCAQGLHAFAARDCLLQGDVSNIKALALHAVDWHLPSTLTNLTHLFLAKRRLRVVDMSRILSIAPRLEDMVLYKISAEEAFNPHENIPAVTLQHLRRLAIYWPDKNIISRLFSHVGLPASLAVNFEHCQVSDLQWLLPLTHNDVDHLCISALTHSVIAASPLKAVRFSTKDDSEVVVVQWIAALLSHFQSKDIWLANTYHWDEFDEAIIKHTPWVETLHLGSLNFINMIEILEKNPTYWPKLTKVVLSRPYHLSNILKLAESRARLGCPLEELECYGMRNTVVEKYSQDVEKIKSHVEAVKLHKDGTIALPLPDVCTDGVPSPWFKWQKKLFDVSSGNLQSETGIPPT